MTDQEILALFKNGDPGKGLQKLYKYYPVVKRFIIKNGGSGFDAEDIFQEALIILMEKIKQPDFSLSASLNTFLFSICKYMWRAELLKRNKSSLFKWDQQEEVSIEQSWISSIEEHSRAEMASRTLSKLGSRCWELIRAFYYEGNSMATIASHLGFSSEKIAKNQKYKCLEKARTELSNLKAAHN